MSNCHVNAVSPHPDGVVGSVSVSATSIADAYADVLAIVKIIELGCNRHAKRPVASRAIWKKALVSLCSDIGVQDRDRRGAIRRGGLRVFTAVNRSYGSLGGKHRAGENRKCQDELEIDSHTKPRIR